VPKRRGRRSTKKAGGWPESSCSCPDCRRACQNSPGWFLPEQLEPLAGHLGLDLAEAFRHYLAVSTTAMPDGTLRHGVMPHKFQDFKKPGSVWSLVELAQPGRCIFYDRGRCTIYPLRPYECSRMLHSQMEQAQALRHWIVRRWTSRALAPYAGWTGVKLRGGGRSAGR
jgi:Fe-S-cluster containining protein